MTIVVSPPYRDVPPYEMTTAELADWLDMLVRYSRLSDCKAHFSEIARRLRGGSDDLRR